jgi:predicted metalloprotease with PDZ domain
MKRKALRAIALALVTVGLMAPALVQAQESKCSSCEVEDRDRLMRRYQQEIERASRDIETLQRRLASTDVKVDTTLVRRLNERLQRAVEQLSRAQSRQSNHLQSLAERSERAATVVTVTPRPSEWMPQAIDGYIGVLWSANVHVEKQKGGEALWTFHDYPQVEAVERESPAERAGILAGDMIVAFNGKDLRAGRIAMNSLLRPGSTVAVRLSRDNRTRSVDVKVAERPRVYVRTPRPPRAAPPAEQPQMEWKFETPAPVEPVLPPEPGAVIAPAPGAFALLGHATVGAEMIALDETLGEPYGTEHGLLVIRVGPGTPAARAGIQKGDVLVGIDGRELRSVAGLIRAVERARKADKSVRIELVRKREHRVVAIEW